MIYLPPQILNRLEDETFAGLPEEVCGLLVGIASGNDLYIDNFLLMRNVSPTPEQAFEIDPEAMLKMQKLLRDQKSEIIGVYHSHPTGDITPSPSDIDQANYPGWVWIIGALDEVEEFQYGAYVHKSDGPNKFCEEEIALTNNSA